MSNLTEEDKILVKKLWLDCVTSGQIAAQLGVTRNTIMGYVSRNGLKRNLKLVILKKKEKQKKPEKIEPRPIMVLFKDKIVRKRSVTITPEKKKALKGKTIFSLKQNSCRFIIGDVDGLNTQYCCLPKKVRSYCESHAEICYEKMRQKRGYKKEIKRRSGLVFTRPKNLAHIT